MLAIYHKDYCISETQPGYWLLQKYPQASFFDKINYIFCETFSIEMVPAELQSSIVQPTPILLSDFVDADGAQLQGDARVWALAQTLALPSAQRYQPIHADRYVLNELHKHPAWRLWVGQYDDQVQFRSDIDYVTGMIEAAGMVDTLVAWTAATTDITYDQAPGIMLTMIRTNSA